ncbi:MAG: response regulator [Butyrivibrio sp.]|nr:response regulator [Butyrivibrio sp.]
MFVSGQIRSQVVFKDRAVQLGIVNDQIANAFERRIERNFDMLDSWKYILENKKDISQGEFRNFIHNEKDVWTFSDFYFINTKGSFTTPEGHTGKLGLSEEELETLSSHKGKVITRNINSDNLPVDVYITPCSGQVNGFGYIAIGFSVDRNVIKKLLNQGEFSNFSYCYIVTATGDTVFSSISESEESQNVLSYLENTQIEGYTYEKVKNDIYSGKANLIKVIDGRNKYYINYERIGYSDFTLYTITDANLLDKTLDANKKVNSIIEAIILITSGLCVIFFINNRHRYKLRYKDKEIAYREWSFDLMLKNSGNIIGIIDDKTYKVDFISQNLLSVLGISVAEAKKDVKNLFKGVMNSGTKVNAEEVKKLEIGKTITEKVQIRNIMNGEIHWFTLHVLHSSFDENTGKFVVFLIDETEGIIHEKQMDEMLEVARNANAVKSQFLANMSHVFRTPMNAIGGYITLLKNNKTDPDKVSEYTEKIDYAYKDMLGLVNDVLEMSKNESGETQLKLEEFNIADVIKKAIGNVEYTAKQNNITISAERKSLSKNYFIGDRQKLEEIIINLLVNAVRYTPKGGNVWVTVTGVSSKLEEYQDIRIDVTDTGIGIDEKNLKTLFDPFSEKINDSPERMKHKGMGIVITKNIVELMGGTISAVSKVGEGTTFTVLLKLRSLGKEEQENIDPTGEIITTAFEEKKDEKKKAEYKKSIKGMRFLAVEDNEINAEIVIEMLKLKGAECEGAEDGEVAVRMYEEHPEQYYDLILMDLMMPNMDGYEATKAIRKIEKLRIKRVPILAMSANAYPDDIEKCYRAGMDGHMAKPLELEKMEKEILKVINRNNK